MYPKRLFLRTSFPLLFFLTSKFVFYLNNLQVFQYLSTRVLNVRIMESICVLLFIMLHFEEIKKFIRGKTLIKNFSNTKAVLVTTISAQMPKPKWLIIHFCSLAKMTALFSWSQSDPRQFRKRYQTFMTALWPMFRNWRHSPGHIFAVKKVKLTKK